MLPKRHITFIGGVGRPDEFGGELTKNKNIIRRLQESDVQVRVVDTWGAHHSIKRAINFLITFFKAAVFHRHDVFIVSTTFSNVYLSIKLICKLPWHYDMVYWVIGGNLYDRIADGSYSMKVLNCFRLLIVEADGMKKLLNEKCGLQNVIVKRNFKDIQVLPRIDKYNDGKIHFIFISRVTKDKGVLNIISVASELNKSGYKNRFAVDFYGSMDSAIRGKFENGIRENDNLKYCGKISLLDWGNYSILAKYHYMLFPTFWKGEGCPGIVIDSCIAGIPVLASDWAFVPEFVHDGATGVIFPAKDDEKLLSTMKDAIDGKFNNGLMSANCQKESALYDTKAVINDAFVNTLSATPF